MDKIKRMIECLLPVTSCNIKCSYCYVVQRDNRKMKMPELKYPPEIIGKGLSKERMGGICYFSICGAGETLLPEVTIDIVREILKQGHYVNITTNGTLKVRFEQLLELPTEYLSRLHIAFSFHYLELIRIKQLDTFFDNVKRMKSAGVSFIVQINLCDEYIPYLEEIKKMCFEQVGAYPQVAATRKENNLKEDVELFTDLSEEEYKRLGDTFNSPLFDFTMKNFNVKQTGFCYAGDWSGQLNLGTGVLSRCYCSCYRQDIFRDINKPIKFCAIGKHCNSLFCMNSSHFLSLGVIPDIYEDVTYADLRNRTDADWYSPRMGEFLNQKLKENNELYDIKDKTKVELYAFYEFIRRNGSLVKHKLLNKRKNK